MEYKTRLSKTQINDVDNYIIELRRVKILVAW